MNFTNKIITSIILFFVYLQINYTFSQDISVLNRDNVLTFVRDNQYAFIFFYTEPLSRQAQRLSEEFNKISSLLSSETNQMPININIAKMDSTHIPKFTKKYFKATKFPALIFFSNGKQTRYDGGNMVENIISWLKRIARSAQLYSQVIFTQEDLTTFIDQHHHTTVFIGDTDTPEFETFHSFAKKWPDSKFAHTSNSDLKTLSNITKEFGIIINNKAEPIEQDRLGVYQTEAGNNILQKEIQNFILENTGITIADFEHNHYHRLARNFEPFFILFIETRDSHEAQAAIIELKKVAKKIKKTLPIIILEKGGKDESSRIYMDEGVRDEDMPIFYIVEREKNRRFRLAGNSTASKIEDFIYKWKNDQLTPIYKSGPKPIENDGLIKEVTRDKCL